jgi:probable phosphoglycerate mutase
MTAASSDLMPPPQPEKADEPEKEQEKATPPTRVVLVRHGVTAETGPILTGRKPGVALSDAGREQAARAAELLAELPVVAVYSSPIQRCAETAAIVAGPHDLEVRTLDDAIEADYGEWQGQKLADLAKTPTWRVVQSQPSAARFPGGESMREMQARMISAVEHVVANHPGELVVIVSHADPIRAAVAHFSGVHLDLFQRLWVSPASCTVLAFGPFGAALVKLNDTGSLAELKPAPPAAEDGAEPPAVTTDA